jgi:hypothetical protein
MLVCNRRSERPGVWDRAGRASFKSTKESMRDECGIVMRAQ